MGKAVANRAGQSRPFGCCRRCSDRFGKGPRLGAPRRRGDFDHAAEQTLFGAAAQQHRTVRAGQPEGDAITHRPFRFLRRRGQRLGQAACRREARPAPRAQHAARSARRANRGAEIHHRLGEVARPPCRDQFRGERSQPLLCRRKRLADGVEAGNDALDIAVDSSHPSVECDRGNRGCGVIADPREHAQRRPFGRECAAVALDDGAGAGVQIAGAGVVAEPLPQVQDLVEGGRGERRNVRPARDELVKIRSDGRYAGLLQHDFAEPDMIGIWMTAGRYPPRQVSALAIVPGEQLLRVGATRGQGQSGSRQIGTDRQHERSDSAA